MKRMHRKMALARETIRTLQTGELGRARGGERRTSGGDMNCDTIYCPSSEVTWCGPAVTFIGCSDACPTFRYDCL